MLQSLASWWTGLPPEVQGATIGAIATTGTAVLGVLAIFYQIGRQARLALEQVRHNLEQARHNEALKLKLEVYKEVVGLTAAASEEYGRTYSIFTSYAREVSTYRNLQGQRIQVQVPRARWEELISRRYSFNRSGFAIIAFVERWTSIDPRITIFKTAINAAQFEVNQAFDNYDREVAIHMPTPNPQDSSQTLPWTPPDGVGVVVIENNTNILIDKISTWGSYIDDFQVEMQNLLIKDLFGNEVPPRQPLVPGFKVIRLDKHDELVRYFETESKWGLNKQEIEKRVVQGN